MAYTPADVNAWYQAVQFRNGTAATVESFVAMLNNGTMTPAQVQQTIIDEPFTSTYVNPMIQIYQAAFNRVPDQAGQNFWVDNYAAGNVTTQTAADNFANSPEFKAQYGNASAADPINAAVLTAFYQNVLGRAPDKAGYDFWLSSGQNIGQVLNYFAQSPEFTVRCDYPINQFQQAEIDGTPATTGSLFDNYPTPVPPVADIVLTTAIETVPTTGVLGQDQKVTGVVTDNGVTANAGSTFQSGDVINGGGEAAKNVLTITASSTIAGDGATATVKNVARIDVKNVGLPAVTFNEALYTGVGQQWVTAAVAGATTNLTNALADSTYGVSSGVADTYNVGFRSGVVDQTFKLALAGAGQSNAARATVDYVQTAAANEIKAISVDAAGTNYLNLNGTTNVKTVTITGAGANKISLAGAGAISTTGAVTIDASAATGDQVIDLGANITTGTLTIKGTADASNTTIGLVLPAALTLPSITNVDGLQLDAGSNGTLIATTANTSIKTLYINDVTAAANADVYTLAGINGVSSVVWGTTGGQNNNGGLLTLSGTGTLAETFALQTNATLATGNNLAIGAQTLNGYTGVSFDTSNGVGSTGTVNIGSVTGTALQSYAVTSASTGFHTLNTLTSTTAGQGTVAAIDLSGIAGGASLNVAANTLGAAATISGATAATTLTFGGAQTGTTSLSVTFNDANNNLEQAGTVLNVNHVVTAGNGNNLITTGNGADVITVGNGANTITAGGGANVITLGTGHFSAGNRDIVNVTGSTASNTINGWALDTATVNGDTLDVTATTLSGAIARTALAANVTFTNGTATQLAVSATNLLTFLDATNTAITLTAADAATAQAALTVAGNIATLNGGGAAANNVVFNAGTSSYYEGVSAGGAVTDVASLVGVTAVGLNTAATAAGYVTLG